MISTSSGRTRVYTGSRFSSVLDRPTVMILSLYSSIERHSINRLTDSTRITRSRSYSVSSAVCTTLCFFFFSVFCFIQRVKSNDTNGNPFSRFGRDFIINFYPYKMWLMRECFTLKNGFKTQVAYSGWT